MQKMRYVYAFFITMWNCVRCGVVFLVLFHNDKLFLVVCEYLLYILAEFNHWLYMMQGYRSIPVNDSCLAYLPHPGERGGDLYSLS